MFRTPDEIYTFSPLLAISSETLKLVLFVFVFIYLIAFFLSHSVKTHGKIKIAPKKLIDG